MIPDRGTAPWSGGPGEQQFVEPAVGPGVDCGEMPALPSCARMVVIPVDSAIPTQRTEYQGAETTHKLAQSSEAFRSRMVGMVQIMAGTNTISAYRLSKA
jgi:hypothetical protein